MPSTATTARNLIVTVTHADEFTPDGELLAQGYTDERDAGPATAEQIEASDRAAEKDGGCGFITVEADGTVAYDRSPTTRSAYVEAE